MGGYSYETGLKRGHRKVMEIGYLELERKSHGFKYGTIISLKQLRWVINIK